jgi:hypothetical protein
MRILTVRQPWAWAIIHGGKDVENRVRNLAGDYRGPVAIHAALKHDVEIESDALDSARNAWFGADHELWDPDELHWPWFEGRGAIIGVVDLVGVHPTRENGECRPMGLGFCSPWAERGMHHLVLTGPRSLAKPIPLKGALGMSELSADVAEQIEREAVSS